MNQDTKVVSFPKSSKRGQPKTDQQMAREIRKAYERLIKLIEAGTESGLKIEMTLDSTDTYGGGRVRRRDIGITRQIK